MSELDVAHVVERADLKQMQDMDIDDVYLLMDLQLRERPGPRELYQRWEKQNWSAYDIDFTKDKQDWDGLPEMLTGQIYGALFAFYLGEAAVTDTLSPLVHAAPTDEDRQFLSTQLVDEARHTVFFDRFFREVLGVDGLRAAREVPEIQDFVLNKDHRGYARLFYDQLPAATEAVRLDPGDYGKWVDGICVYHMVIEGMLALYGQRLLLQAARAFDILPGFRAGFTAVTRDESRHVNYGVFALRIATERGYHDRIVDTTSGLLENACAVLTRTTDQVPAVDPGQEALLPEVLRQGTFAEQWHFPVMQLRKRLRQGGITKDGLDRLESLWWDHVDTNLEEYRERFGEEHPARNQPDWASRRQREPEPA